MPTIKLTNDVLLDGTSLQAGPDYNNVLASGKTTYTCTQNCFIEVPMTDGSNGLAIDGYGVGWFNYFNYNSQYVSKGTIVAIQDTSKPQRIKAFGLK